MGIAQHIIFTAWLLLLFYSLTVQSDYAHTHDLLTHAYLCTHSEIQTHTQTHWKVQLPDKWTNNLFTYSYTQSIEIYAHFFLAWMFLSVLLLTEIIMTYFQFLCADAYAHIHICIAILWLFIVAVFCLFVCFCLWLCSFSHDKCVHVYVYPIPFSLLKDFSQQQLHSFTHQNRHQRKWKMSQDSVGNSNM